MPNRGTGFIQKPEHPAAMPCLRALWERMVQFSNHMCLGLGGFGDCARGLAARYGQWYLADGGDTSLTAAFRNLNSGIPRPTAAFRKITQKCDLSVVV